MLVKLFENCFGQAFLVGHRLREMIGFGFHHEGRLLFPTLALVEQGTAVNLGQRLDERSAPFGFKGTIGGSGVPYTHLTPAATASASMLAFTEY